MTIPKIIHQIWFGSIKKPSKLMDTWKFPGWEYILWTEDNLPEIENRKLFDYFMNEKIYYGASDVLRIEVVHSHGGVYVDCDTTCVNSIDGAPFMMSDFFVCHEGNEHVDRYANGFFGSIKNHELLARYIKEMGATKEVMPCWSTIGGTMLTKIAHDFAVMVLPSTYLHAPQDYTGQRYAQHHWASWHGYNKDWE